ncbi:MAG: acetylornithine deacetylase [Pseudomonadales bacterium]|nr:acetylornithine deacetylase [Pseudomonadales bacterium]
MASSLSPSLQQRINSLISIASVSSVSPQWDMGNRPVIDLLAAWFSELGFNIHIQDLSNNKANLIACKGSGPGGLVLSGHSDTVPFDEARWASNPLAATEKNGRLYGLGTADMKSFFALIIEAVMPLLEQDFQQPLIILATADEESSMSGAKALSQISSAEGIYLGQAKAAIIGEPTGLKPIYMHKSIMMNALEVTGQSGHSSDPSLGHSALEAMHDLITELKSYRDEVQEQHSMSEFKVQVPTLNLGCIHGGDNPNRICNACELHFDFRGLPGMNNAAVREQLQARLQPIADQHQVELNFRSLFGGVDAFAEDKTSELIQIAERLSGSDSEAVAFATEAPFLKAMGMETVVFGPGSIDQAHQPDEFIDIKQMHNSVKILRQFIQHYCLKSAASA